MFVVFACIEFPECWCRYPAPGIPKAYVVGKDLKISWVGHPNAGLDKAIADAVAATEVAKSK